MRALLVAAGAIGMLLLAAPLHQAQAGDRGLAGTFMCQCGCGLTLASCTHASCGPRDQVLAEIARLQRGGADEAQITAALVASYGETILAAPTRRGFNLLAWWGPYGALAAGAALILGLASIWVRRPRPAGEQAPELTPDERQLLDRALERFRD